MFCIFIWYNLKLNSEFFSSFKVQKAVQQLLSTAANGLFSTLAWGGCDVFLDADTIYPHKEVQQIYQLQLLVCQLQKLQQEGNRDERTQKCQLSIPKDTVAKKGQTHFKLRQQMQIDKTRASWENIFINFKTYAQHQFANSCVAF